MSVGTIKAINTAMGNMPFDLRKMIDSKHGSQPIEYVVLQRKNVIKAVQKLINIVSKDAMEKAKQKNNYDDYYHLSAVFKVKGLPTLVRLEKVAKVEVSFPKTPQKDAEQLRIDVNNGSTLKSMIEGAEEIYKTQGLSPYRYTATQNNCQRWVMNLMMAIKKDTEEATTFVLQDTLGVLGNNKGLETVANATTGIAGVAQSFFGGSKKQRMKSYIHSVGFDAETWTAQKSRSWLKKHNLQPIKRMHRMGNQLRYRITDPEQYKRFSSKATQDGILLVFGYK